MMIHTKIIFFLFKESWKRYLQEIQQATAKYQDCSNKKCGCYSDVIDDDLRIWKDRGGITKKDFDNSADRGVHYQIIDHKLYREEKCMFTFRWAKFCNTLTPNILILTLSILPLDICF